MAPSGRPFYPTCRKRAWPSPRVDFLQLQLHRLAGRYRRREVDVAADEEGVQLDHALPLTYVQHNCGECLADASAEVLERPVALALVFRAVEVAKGGVGFTDEPFEVVGGVGRVEAVDGARQLPLHHEVQ